MNPFKVGPQRSGFYFLQGYYSHRVFCEWVEERAEEINSVLEYGCGYFDYYSHFFSSLCTLYTGIDISEKIIEYRKLCNPNQDFFCCDFLNYFSSPEAKTDLVFSHMVVDGTLGEETNLRLLEATVKASCKYGYVVIWGMNNVNLTTYREYLTTLGCFHIDTFPVETGLCNEHDPTQEIVLRWEQ